MGHIKIKQFRDIIVADELQEHGTVIHIQIYPREILKRALSLGASSLILVHNHPSGNIKPSKEDIEVTKQLLQSALLMPQSMIMLLSVIRTIIVLKQTVYY